MTNELTIPVSDPEEIGFVVKEDFVNKLPEILSNIAQIKAWALERTEQDRTLVLQTEKDFETAKKRCAELNRVIDSIEKKKREVKKAYNAPYLAFETALKDVIGVLSEAQSNLWSQVRQAEANERAAKEAELRTAYEEMLGDNLEYKPFEQVFRDSWTNRSVTRKKVLAEMSALAEGVKKDLESLKSVGGENTATLLVAYKNGSSLNDCLNLLSKIQEEQKKVRVEKPEETPVDPETAAEEPKETDEVLNIAFRVYCTRKQLAALKDFLLKNKIKYGKA